MKCPYCGNAEIGLLRRTRWSKLIPGFEYYDCNNCGGTHSRLFIRPRHSFFIAIASFLITCGLYWIMEQTSPPYYREIEKYIAETSQPMKSLGLVEDLPVFKIKKDFRQPITTPGPENLVEQVGASAVPEVSPVPEVEFKKDSRHSVTQPDVTNLVEQAGASPPPEVSSAPEVVEKSAPVSTKPEEKIDRKPKIKVLIGNRRRASAEKLAVQLKHLGYKVDRIDEAPRSNFQKLTIYYKNGFKPRAKKIGRKLEMDFIDKKLSWESQFDLILVTGGNK